MNFEDVRFLSSVGVITTFALLLHFIEILAINGVPSRPIAVFISLSLYIWFTVFGQWVTRARRAIFNERNLLVTYQPRALTHGHLFVPDPPTPCRLSITPCESGSDTEFKNARDAHYKDEFHRAIKMANERLVIRQESTQIMRMEFNTDTSSPPTSPDKSEKSPEFF
ncbi:PH domain-containing protein [Caenorhabditis elegans]|uniref:PH domain-containing protein n=1 Tax=Caenorhabditis elegans TaxID=6239 RepID=Q18481_CAEEL|nr:PH domain-containing protein [Caenorhabditis elegans]CCD66780.1 PH domain-containing protein [Caenorhabditis elegans]|eukprot:NP_498008.2 Uncharacterized protein CELE_C35D10.8 [Caenorhabditis elegans]